MGTRWSEEGKSQVSVSGAECRVPDAGLALLANVSNFVIYMQRFSGILVLPREEA
jgi:hypothetical protein